MIAALREHARYPVPSNVEQEILQLAARYGRVVITGDGNFLRCTCRDQITARHILRDSQAGQYLTDQISATEFRVAPDNRGVLKQVLVAAGYPAEDLAGYLPGEHLDMGLRANTLSGKLFQVRDYQHRAAEAFYLAGSERGGSGVIVLPCGAGKTIVGLVAMDLVKQTTLVLTTSLAAVKQWRRELLDKTSLREEDIADYTGERKGAGPVTLTTYQVLTWRSDRRSDFPTPRAIRGPFLGAHHLRRSSPLACTGLPGHGGAPGTKATWTDRNPGARGRPRDRCLCSHRTKAFRCTLEGPRAASLDCGRQLRRTARSYECRGAHAIRIS